PRPERQQPQPQNQQTRPPRPPVEKAPPPPHPKQTMEEKIRLLQEKFGRAREDSPPKLGGVAVRAFFSERRGGSPTEPPRLRLSKVASQYPFDGAASPPE